METVHAFLKRCLQSTVRPDFNLLNCIILYCPEKVLYCAVLIMCSVQKLHATRCSGLHEKLLGTTVTDLE